VERNTPRHTVSHGGARAALWNWRWMLLIGSGVCAASSIAGRLLRPPAPLTGRRHLCPGADGLADRLEGPELLAPNWAQAQ